MQSIASLKSDLLFLILVDGSSFLFFSARGRGRGSLRHQEGAGVGFLLKIPGGAGGSPTRGGGGGAGRVSAGNFGGGPKYFFSGPKCPPSDVTRCNGLHHKNRNDVNS